MIPVSLFPLMQLNIGWDRFTRRNTSGQKLRIVTCNIHHMNIGDPDLQKFFAEIHADVVLLEESPEFVLRQQLPADLPHVARMGEITLAEPISSLGGERGL